MQYEDVAFLYPLLNNKWLLFYLRQEGNNWFLILFQTSVKVGIVV